MIVYYNVCDQCGTQTDVTEDGTQFEFSFTVVSVFDSMMLGHRRPSNIKSHTGTFCDRDCLIAFLETNVRKNGSFTTDEPGNTKGEK